MNKFKIIDLFAGAGGLSLGFEKTGNYEIALAVEVNPHMRDTYSANHKNTKLKSDIRTLNYSSIKKEFGDIDVVIGGPPCQGFSNANRQKNTLISDNNQLVKEYIKAIESIKPKSFVMENVKNIISNKHKFFCTKSDFAELKSLNIETESKKIEIGVCNSISKKIISEVSNNFESFSLRKYIMNEKGFSLLNVLYKKHIKDLSFIPTEKHSSELISLTTNWNKLHNHLFNSEYKKHWNNIYSKIISGDYCKDFFSSLTLIIETQIIIRKFFELETYNIKLENAFIENTSVFLILRTYNVFDYIKKKLTSLGYEIDYKVLNAINFGVPQTRNRLIMIGVLDSITCGAEVKVPTSHGIYGNQLNHLNIGSAIKDLENLIPYTDISSPSLKHTYTEDSDFMSFIKSSTNEIHNHITTSTREIALKRFKQLKPGQNFHNLDDSFKSTYHNPSRTQNTVYKRLDYTKPSPTVCNVRKSMWIHPTIDRALSIREAARLQSFPDDFIFKGTKDAQYQQIGNAVPPLLGNAIALTLLDYLKK